jgi:hypothetical protein
VSAATSGDPRRLGYVTSKARGRISGDAKSQESQMRQAAIATFLVASICTAAQAQSRDYAFCAYGGKASEGMRCDYATLAQCQASTAGGGGSCVANPRPGQGATTARDGAPPRR